jgi:hypothetical protein
MTAGDREMTCAEVRERLPLRFYEPPGDERGDPLGRHLRHCPACAGEWAATCRALAAVRAEDAFPREGEVDWDALARDTAARAPAARRAAVPAAGRSRRWAAWGGLVAAAACLLVVVALRHPGRPGRDQARFTPAPGMAGMLRQSVAREAAARSLREGRALLVDLMQAPVRCRRGDGTIDLALEKERSRDLLRRLAVHQGALGGPEDGRIADLVGQMESLLLQVGTLDDCAGPHSLDELRAAIRRRQILLRIDLVTRDVEGGTSRA